MFSRSLCSFCVAVLCVVVVVGVVGVVGVFTYLDDVSVRAASRHCTRRSSAAERRPPRQRGR